MFHTDVLMQGHIGNEKSFLVPQTINSPLFTPYLYEIDLMRAPSHVIVPVGRVYDDEFLLQRRPELLRVEGVLVVLIKGSKSPPNPSPPTNTL